MAQVAAVACWTFSRGFRGGSCVAVASGFTVLLRNRASEPALFRDIYLRRVLGVVLVHAHTSNARDLGIRVRSRLL
eukprot:1055397-Amorphochlora_amoeboformis.AAC.2